MESTRLLVFSVERGWLAGRLSVPGGGNLCIGRFENDGGGEGEVIVPAEIMAGLRGTGCARGAWARGGSDLVSKDRFFSSARISARESDGIVARCGFVAGGIGLANASSARAFVTRIDKPLSAAFGLVSVVDDESKSNLLPFSWRMENWSSVGNLFESSSAEPPTLGASRAAKGSLDMIRSGDGLGFAELWCSVVLVGLPRRIGAISGIVCFS
jgi:hypothetical protein